MFKNLKEQYLITYDSDASGSFIVHREEQGMSNMEFKMHESGLHYHDLLKSQEANVFLNTVSANKEGYSKRQVKAAELSKVLYSKLGYPLMKDYDWAIRSNQINNCPVTVDNIKTAEAIWGKYIAAL